MNSTNGETDKKATEGAQKELSEDYNVAGNNCVDMCSGGLKNAGLNPGYEKMVSSGGIGSPGVVDEKHLSPVPNTRYQAIIKNNPGGTDVTKRLTRKP